MLKSDTLDTITQIEKVNAVLDVEGQSSGELPVVIANDLQVVLHI